MKSRRLWIAFGLAVASLTMAGSRLHAEENPTPLLLKEEFGSYKEGAVAVTELGETWDFISGHAPAIVSMPELDKAPVLSLANGVMAVRLKHPPTKSATLEAEVLHTNYRRGQWFGFFDRNRTHGYVVNWDSSSEESFNSQGFLTLRKVDLGKISEENANAAGQLTMNLAGSQQLGAAIKCPRPDGEEGKRATTGAFAKIRLEWKQGGDLVVSVDGEPVIREWDAEFTEPEAVVVSGNDAGIYRKIAVFGE